MGSEPKSILIVQTAFLGDVVLTTPLITALRDSFPEGRIAVLVIPGTRPILENHPAVDELLIFDKKGADRGLRGLRETARRLRSRRYDIALLPHRSFRSALLARLAGIPERIGYYQTGAAILYTKRVWRPAPRHEVDRCLALVRPLGIRPPSGIAPLSVAVGREEKAEIRRRLEAHGVRPADRLVAISPGSVWATKRWTEEGFAAVAEHFAQQENVKVILLGSQADRPVADRILKQLRAGPGPVPRHGLASAYGARRPSTLGPRGIGAIEAGASETAASPPPARAPHPVLDLTGQTTLRQLSALLERASVLLTNDNGSMHIGEAVGVPIVAIFGATTPQMGYGPRSDRSTVVEHPLPCRPCGRHGHTSCPLGHFLCMRSIQPDEVIAAVEKMMDDGKNSDH
jgi:heptosyltransferase-2